MNVQQCIEAAVTEAQEKSSLACSCAETAELAKAEILSARDAAISARDEAVSAKEDLQSWAYPTGYINTLSLLTTRAENAEMEAFLGL